MNGFIVKSCERLSANCDQLSSAAVVAEPKNHGRNAPKEDEPTADVRAYLVGIEAVVLSQTLGVSAETEVRSQYHSYRLFARAEENPLGFW